jgi:Ca2+-binding EF-hand superfamily protein
MQETDENQDGQLDFKEFKEAVLLSQKRMSELKHGKK